MTPSRKWFPPPKESSTEMLVSPPTKQKLHRIHRQLVGTLHLLVFLVFQFRVSNSSCPHAELKRCNSHPLTVTLFMIVQFSGSKYQQKSILFFFPDPRIQQKILSKSRFFAWKPEKKFFWKCSKNAPKKPQRHFQAAPFGSRPAPGESLRRRDNERMRSLRRLGENRGNGGNVGGLWDVKGWKMGLKHSKKIYHILN